MRLRVLTVALALACALSCSAEVQKLVAITIDDGPFLDWTQSAMDIADEHGATLTFFVVGQFIHANPNIAPLIVERGHEIENHSYNHPLFTRLGADKIEWQIERTAQLVKQQTGIDTKFMRPPYGDYSRRVGDAVVATEHRLAMWTIDPMDWNGRSADAIARYVVSHAHDGGVVLLHQKRNTLKALPDILEGLSKKGYRCVGLKEIWGPPDEVDPQMAPVRSTVEEGATIGWSRTNGYAVISTQERIVVLRPGDDVAEVNGHSVKMPAPARLYHDQLYAHAGFLLETLWPKDRTESGGIPPPETETLTTSPAPPAAAATPAPGGQPLPPTAERPSGAASPATTNAPPATSAPGAASAAPTAVEPTPPKPTRPQVVEPTVVKPLGDQTPPPTQVSPSTTAPPSLYQQQVALGLRRKRAGEMAAAVADLFDALRLKPDGVEARWALAWTLLELRLTTRAAEQFAEVIRLAPGSQRAAQAKRQLQRMRS